MPWDVNLLVLLRQRDYDRRRDFERTKRREAGVQLTAPPVDEQNIREDGALVVEPFEPSGYDFVDAFEVVDAGDAASNGTIKILPPVETGGAFTGCTGAGKVNGPLSNCQITGINSTNGWDGKTQHIEVPIPAGYTCNDASAGGCWFRVQVSFGSGTVTDVTTWNAEVVGEPVRLIE